MARPEDLDGEGGRRSREHTELLVNELELGVLWDEYGLVGDIVVSKTASESVDYMLTCIFSHLRMTSRGPTSMS